MPLIGDIAKGKTLGFTDSHKYIWQACIKCGKERWISYYHLKANRLSGLCRSCVVKGRHPTIETIERMKQAHKYKRGTEASGWKGGRIKRIDGYISIRLQPNDFFYPMIDSDGYVREHRLVMAKHLNRCLLSWEVVHHKGTRYPQGSIENRSDNRLENLELLPTQKQHLTSMRLQQRVKELEKRVTLLEAENTLLRAKFSFLGVVV